MDGRWKLWLASGIFFSLLGCTHSNTVSSPSGSAPIVSNKARVEDKRDKKDGPPSPDTLVVMADTHLAAAMQEGHTPTERQSLLALAANEYQQALQRDPKNLRGYGGLAEMYTFMGDKPKALETYQRAFALYPTSSDICVKMAICCKQFNDTENYLDYLHKATKLNPGDRRLKINLGFALAMSQRFDEGFAWLKQSQGEPQAHLSLAQVYSHQGNRIKAQNELELSLRVDPNYQPAKELLAQLSESEQSVSENGAIKTVGYEDASSISPDRLAPNAKLISQIDGKPITIPTPKPDGPAALMQTPGMAPSNGPKPLPPMPLNPGWDR